MSAWGWGLQVVRLYVCMNRKKVREKWWLGKASVSRS
jgi:hypothetical protein